MGDKIGTIGNGFVFYTRFCKNVLYFQSDSDEINFPLIGASSLNGDRFWGLLMTKYQQQQAGCLLEILRLTSQEIEDRAYVPAELVFAAIEAEDASDDSEVGPQTLR